MTAASRGPLAGLTVVELSGLGPAPFAGLLLAELGADVVRIDRPGGNSPLDDSGGLGRSRPSVAVDLKHPEGLATVQRLIDGADVLVEGLRPGVTERLGLGPDDCLRRNPRLVYARMTGWGQQGPLAQRAGHDITYAAITGALHLTGTAERPIAPVNVLADFGGGTLYLLVGILAALHARESTGRGQVVDAAMVDGAASLVTMFYGLLGSGAWQDRRGVNLLDGGAPFYDTYTCADRKFVAVGALEPPFYAALLEGLGLTFERSQYDPRGFAEQRAAFTRTFLTRTRDEWAEHFAGSDACVAPVLSLTEAPTHPHLAARGTFAQLDGHPVPRVAPRFSDTPALDPTPERPIGADSRAHLLAHGFTVDEVDRLLASGAVVQR
ncbi:MAG: CaiB/BaiF CoA-transferase family protein [Nostocoides sp.]